MKDKQGWTRDTPTEADQVGWWWFSHADDKRLDYGKVSPFYLDQGVGGGPLRVWPSGLSVHEFDGYWQRAEVPTPPGQADREEG